eukprot:COSAG01_NODE_5462_length_4249_cov_3.039759_1_plen_341_part_00
MITAVPTRYVVPAKQAVFKHAPHRDLGQCVLSWLERRDGPELARRKEGSAVQLQAARQAALAAAPTGDDSSLRAVLLYYHCLRALDLPFGTDEASGQLHVRFEFTDAFNTGSKSKSYDPVLEAASMLFNAAASLSAQAAQARSQVTPESIKRQCSLYRMASGLFQHLREEVQFELAYRAGSALTADLSVEALRALELIMLAQAQECVWRLVASSIRRCCDCDVCVSRCCSAGRESEDAHAAAPGASSSPPSSARRCHHQPSQRWPPAPRSAGPRLPARPGSRGSRTPWAVPRSRARTRSRSRATTRRGRSYWWRRQRWPRWTAPWGCGVLSLARRPRGPF